MISIKKCRELIPDSDKYSDEYIERIRDDTRALVEIIFEKWIKERKNSSQKV